MKRNINYEGITPHIQFMTEDGTILFGHGRPIVPGVGDVVHYDPVLEDANTWDAEHLKDQKSYVGKWVVVSIFHQFTHYGIESGMLYNIFVTVKRPKKK